MFARNLFPRLPYMQDLITFIKQGSAGYPQTTPNIITYDPLPDTGDGLMPRRREFSTYPELRPTVEKYRPEPYENNMDYKDFVELYGHDEARGLLKMVLDEGTMIEVTAKNEHGEPIWVKGRVSSTTAGSLKFKSQFLGYLDHANWAQTLSRADMGSTWRLPPATRLGQLGVAATLSIPMAPLFPWLSLAPTPTSRGLEV